MAGKTRKKKIQFPYEYDQEKRRKAKIYTKIKIISGLVNGIAVPIIFLLGVFFFGASFLLKDFISGPSGIFLIPLYIFILNTFLIVITFPLSLYSGYFYEHKYGLSNQNKRQWATDYLKGLLLEYVFTVPVLTIVYLLLPLSFWWVYAGLLYFFLGIFMNTIWPVLILPFFYKTQPFENKRLRQKLLTMAENVGAHIQNVVVAKESEKSNKANAIFAGMGKTKKIILFDTLLDNFTEDEVETVIGHELGHYVNKDTQKGIVLGTAFSFVGLFVIHLILSLPGLGLAGRWDIAGLPLFLLSFDVLELIFMPLSNSLSRKWERGADLFGLEHSKKPKAQISTEKRLADMGLLDDHPPWIVELILFSHPAAEKRIRMVEEWEAQES